VTCAAWTFIDTPSYPGNCRLVPAIPWIPGPECMPGAQCTFGRTRQIFNVVPCTVSMLGPYSDANLTHLNIPAGVTTIPSGAFMGCMQTQHVSIPSSVEVISGSAALPGSEAGVGAFEAVPMTSLTIAEGVKIIGDYAFVNTLSLSGTLSLPSTLESTGNWSFQRSNISNLFIAEGVKRVGTFSFWGTNNLGNISLPSSLTSIGSFAFAGAGTPVDPSRTPALALTSVTIPENVALIEREAFHGCRYLKTLNFAGNSPALSIETGAFLETQLTSVTVPARAAISHDSFPPGCVVIRKLETE
jgi:hypothetical protein